jgi:hypothetical protein
VGKDKPTIKHLGEAIKMSDQGFRGVPGVPDGWELVEIRKAVSGDWVINAHGCLVSWNTGQSLVVYPIIRKIEVPKQYRPFANGAEYIAKRRDAIAVDWNHRDRGDGFYAVVSANDSFVWVAFGKDIEVFSWKLAFERLVFRHIDGSTSPFGVEVTE